jgi:pimeloyl-ACP methyl ester carboxylesterase
VLGTLAVGGMTLAACSGGDAGPGSTAPGTGASTAPDPTGGTASASTLDWGPCDDPDATDPALECTTITVPLDYEVPEGGTIDLALIRLPAEGRREGAVLTNPGGPGASGFELVALAGGAYQVQMGLERFDIVGFDPRGVDRSGGVRCLTDEQFDASVYLDETPDTPAEQALFDAAPPDLDEACVDAYGDQVRHYSTANTARDMDAIRAAMGDEQISYLGVSYGTNLGGVYATLFPDRVRAMVLDAAYDPAGDSVEESLSTQLVGFEEAFDNWAAWCADTPDECAFSSNDVGADWDALYDQLDLVPITHTDGRLGNDVVMGLATITALYSPTSWPVLGSALDEARQGSADGIFALADSYIARSPEGTYSTQLQSQWVIDCASGFTSPPPDDPEALLEQLQGLAPRFAADLELDDLTESSQCTEVLPSVEPFELAYAGSAPIVVVGGENDPATPIRWAEEMTESLGSSATLVRYTGEGHGFVLVSSCVTEIAAALLTDLEPPAADTVCEPDPEIERPDWWNDLPLEGWVEIAETNPELLAALGLAPTLAYSEIGFSDLAADDVLDAADEALAALPGLVDGGRAEPIPGIDQATYLIDDEIFSVLVIGQDDLATPDLEGLAPLLGDEDRTLVVLLHFPM